MELFVVLLLAYGVWASKRSLNTMVSLRSEDLQRSWRCPDPSGSTCKEPDWYWTRYNGNVSRNAFDAGDYSNPDSLGKLYIGQAFVENVGLLPGSLYAGSRRLQVCENWNISTLSTNVMIFCTKRKLNVRWIKINLEQLPCLQKIPGIKLIKGGFQRNVPVYIGRLIYDGVRLVGKVYPEVGLALINKNKILGVFKSFEILVYIPLEYDNKSC